MSATMTNMEYVLADVLNADQLMVEDLISLEGEIVEVINIASLPTGYAISYRNDFGEEDIVEVDDNAQFDFYVLVDD